MGHRSVRSSPDTAPAVTASIIEGMSITFWLLRLAVFVFWHLPEWAVADVQQLVMRQRLCHLFFLGVLTFVLVGSEAECHAGAKVLVVGVGVDPVVSISRSS